MNQRCAVRQLRSYQGTNFIGARSELKAALCEMNQEHVKDYLRVDSIQVERTPF